MWKVVDGPYLLIGIANKIELKSISKIFEALIIWYKIDPAKIEEFLLSEKILESLLKYALPHKKLLNTQEYIEILPFIKEIINISPRIARIISR